MTLIVASFLKNFNASSSSAIESEHRKSLYLLYEMISVAVKFFKKLQEASLQNHHSGTESTSPQTEVVSKMINEQLKQRRITPRLLVSL